MRIRTMLTALSGGSATGGAVELACRLAGRFTAHLEGFHVVPNAAAIIAATGEGISSPASAALAESMMRAAAEKAAQARAVFDETVARHGIARDAAGWREATGDTPRLVAARARFFDLAVLGRSDRVIDEPHSDTVEETLLRSGRPVLLAPAAAAGDIGRVIAVAWNGSPQAVHAMAAALPFLAAAGTVLLITAGDAEAGSGAAAIEYLGRHGIKAEPRRIAAAPGRRMGGALLEAAGEAGADLLVMGAYGQSPWREQLFGGATRSAVASSPLALFLMH